MERAARFIGGNFKPRLQQDVAGIEPLIHVHDADSRFAIARQDRRLDRRRAAVPWQKRRVQIQAGDSRNLQDRTRQDLSVGHHHDHIRRERAYFRDGLFAFDSGRLQDRQLAVRRAPP